MFRPLKYTVAIIQGLSYYNGSVVLAIFVASLVFHIRLFGIPCGTNCGSCQMSETAHQLAIPSLLIRHRQDASPLILFSFTYDNFDTSFKFHKDNKELLQFNLSYRPSKSCNMPFFTEALTPNCCADIHDQMLLGFSHTKKFLLISYKYRQRILYQLPGKDRSLSNSYETKCYDNGERVYHHLSWFLGSINLLLKAPCELRSYRPALNRSVCLERRIQNSVPIRQSFVSLFFETNNKTNSMV
jgi:hypothetical protein